MKPTTVGPRSMVGNLTEEQERWLERQMACAPELAVIALTVDAGKMPRWDFMGFVEEGVWDWQEDDFTAFLKQKVASCGLAKRVNGRAVLTVRVVKLEWDKRRQWISGEDPNGYVERAKRRATARREKIIAKNKFHDDVNRLGAAKARSKLLKALNEDQGEALKRQYGVRRKVAK